MEADTSDSPTRGPRLAVEGMSVSYRRRFRRRTVLRHLDLTARPGHVTAVIGPNGAGKTTLMRVLFGVMAPDRGSCLLSGMTPHRYRIQHVIGYMAETQAYPAHWRLCDVLARGVDLAEPPGHRAKALRAASALTGLEPDLVKQRVTHCSKGTRKRAGLAFAFASKPRLMLLDEPFVDLDPPGRTALRQHINAAREQEATIVFATHNLDEVTRLADRVYVLEKGRIRRGAPPKPDERPRDLGIEAFLPPEEA